MAPGVLSVIVVGIQWLPVWYVGNLDIQDIIMVNINICCDLISIMLNNIGATQLELFVCSDHRKQLIVLRCLGSEQRLIDCRHIVISNTHGCCSDVHVICQPCITIISVLLALAVMYYNVICTL